MQNKVSYSLAFFLLINLLAFSSVKAQYEIQSVYLQNPDAIIPFIMESADFWKNSVDWDDGGFYTEVLRDGTPELTTRKSFVQCSRHAYGFSRAFMVSGDEEYLDYANHALQFIYDYGWDTENEGWFFSSNKTGNLAPPYGGGWNPNNEKWSFQQHYDVLGISAMAEATRDPLHLTWFDQAALTNDNNLWDDRPGFEGFYETANVNWTNKQSKGFTPTIDAITTWVLSRALLTNEQQDIDRLIAVADNVMDHLYESMFLPQVNLGFPESFTSNWEVNPNHTGASTGHVIKTAWCLARAYMFTQNTDYLDAAQFMINDIMLNGGYDYNNGGLYDELNWSTADVVTNKNHWMLEQGLTSGLINYFIASDSTDRALNLRMADGCLDFYMNHFIDEEYGECYLATSATGTVINNDKSDPFKGGYHNIEMAYLTYVYGNLFVQNKPITLYYRFEESTQARTFKMTPLAIIDDLLFINDIQLDGAGYTNYNGGARTVTIPAGVGGVFKITYSLDEIVATNTLNENTSPGIYPNPAHDYIYLQGLNKEAHIDLFTIEGQLITSFDYTLNGGKMDISSIPSGIYLMNIQSDGEVWNQKIIKQ